MLACLYPVLRGVALRSIAIQVRFRVAWCAVMCLGGRGELRALNKAAAGKCGFAHQPFPILSV